MAKENKLADNFVCEIMKCAFKDDSVFEILVKHLKFSYLSFDYEKKFWKKATQLFHEKNKIPSLGLIQAELRKDEDVRDFINDVKLSKDVHKKDLIVSFQEFIRESMFVEAFEKAGELYNRGEQDKALEAYRGGAENINNFSIQDKLYEKFFENFDERFEERKNPENHGDKVPFYIDGLDEMTSGGPERGETVLFLAESGIGKSQLLIHYAIRTSVSGKNVLFFQIEGTKKQVMTRMDAAWSGIPYNEVKVSRLSGDDLKKKKKLDLALKRMKGEIYIEAFERFGGVTISSMRNSIREAIKLYGEIHLVCVDYLELCDLEDGVNYNPSTERFRQQKIAQQFKEIAMEFNTVLATVTQASNLPSDLKNDPAFVMTREYLSEAKNKIQPFDMHFTLNQTYSEKMHKNENGEFASVIRLYGDKIRDNQSGETTHVVTNFKRSRFYDRIRTIEYINNNDEIT